MAKWIWLCLPWLFLQCEQYGSQTRSRILQVINHVDLVSERVLASLLKQIDSNRNKTKHFASCPCSYTDLSTCECCWWAWRCGRTKTSLTLTSTRRRPWTTSCCGAGPTSWRGESTTRPSLWREPTRAGAPRYEPASRVPVVTRRVLPRRGKDFDGDTVGLANKFAMCTENSGGVNQVGAADSRFICGLRWQRPFAGWRPVCFCHRITMTAPSASPPPSRTRWDTTSACPTTPPAACAARPTAMRTASWRISWGRCARCQSVPLLLSTFVKLTSLRPTTRTGSQTFPEFFSDCSVDQFAEFMNRAQPTCLSQPASSVSVIAVGPLCGNALLDAGEECDCGTAEVED